MEYRDRLKTARVNRGYSQCHLAKMCELSSAYISGVESGKIKPSEKFKQKIGGVLPETLGEEAPKGVSQILSMKLNSEAERNEKKGKDEKMEDWISKAVEAFNAPQAHYGTFENVPKDVAPIKAIPTMETGVSELARAIVERDVYKALYERLLDRVLSE